MALLIHIIIALGSVFFSTYLLFYPNETRLRVSYALVGLTIATGTILVFMNPGKLFQACMSGLLYVVIVSVIIGFARNKLHTSTLHNS